MKTASILLRIEPEFKEALKKKAILEDRSLMNYLVRVIKLAHPVELERIEFLKNKKLSAAKEKYEIAHPGLKFIPE